MTRTAVAVVGGGRVGLSFARALAFAGWQVAVLSRSVRALPGGLGSTVTGTDWPAAIAASRLVIITVPDDAIVPVAGELASTGAIGPGHVVLHCSGAMDRTVLAPLAAAGAATGSFHPLQSFSDENGSPGLLEDTAAVIEGAPAALAAAHEVATTCRMSPVVEIDPTAKVRYHAAAVFASNYLVALAGVVDRLARESGIPQGVDLFAPLMRQTLAGTSSLGPAAALTGPIRRGDLGVVKLHLGALEGELRQLYCMLGREALALCEDELPADAVTELRGLLADRQ